MKNLFIVILLICGSFISANTAETEAKEARALVVATEKVAISSEISARVEKINFLMGDAFNKGDVLITFDCKLYKAQLEVLKADHKSAKVQLKNDKDLLDMR